MRAIFYSLPKFSLITFLLFISLVVSAVNKDIIPKAVAVSFLILLCISIIWLTILVLLLTYRKLSGKSIDVNMNIEDTRERKPSFLRGLTLMVVLGMAILLGIGTFIGKSGKKVEMKVAESSSVANHKIIRAPTQLELMGEWKQVSIVPITYKFDPGNFWFTGTQHYEFLPDNKLRTIVLESTGNPDTNNTSFAITMGKSIPPQNSYESKDGGIVIITQKDGKKLAAHLGFMTENYDPNYNKTLAEIFKEYSPKKGDLLMTFINNKAEPLFMRIFEKVDANK